MRVRHIPLLLLGCALLPGCKDKEVDAGGGEKGESCDPLADAEAQEEQHCADGFACEPIDGGDGYVCAAPLEIRGMVYDALSKAALEGALVSALDETGAPVSDVAVTDASGNYVLQVSAVRDPEGEIATNAKWTLFSTADDYLPFPAGIRPAIPVNAADAVPLEYDPNPDDDDDGKITVDAIDNASTDVALIPLAAADAIGVTVTGSVAGENGGGTLVVAEGGATAPYTIADASGAFTLFNVPPGAITVRGYRADLEVQPASLNVADADIADVVLEVVSEDPGGLSRVSGSVNIVNAPGGSTTSVVLIPISVYNDVLERGPVPFGLRAPRPPEAPTISGAFEIGGVPSGTYKVLAAFENDQLVRDPDMQIAGTQIQEITVTAGTPVVLDASFKITEALPVISPGVDAPEVVATPPDLVWGDDSSEDFYTLVVFDALGNIIWEVPDVPRVTGSPEVRVTWGGPALTEGMYYQFRATSVRDTSPISRTEDLRGVFVFGTAEPPPDDGG